ncbi:hypothetical protein I4F81_002167 [Pyropia yezoensis]|uniref:Uncharacterized protein n=1 Tax=Pyropia yezoensis TaxID=2788 RepID=A0ACC3BQ21_PYRYE|nr:hypothetical protein I4F81_002167 [Neopyropia yezoensis]
MLIYSFHLSLLNLSKSNAVLFYCNLLNVSSAVCSATAAAAAATAAAATARAAAAAATNADASAGTAAAARGAAVGNGLGATTEASPIPVAAPGAAAPAAASNTARDRLARRAFQYAVRLLTERASRANAPLDLLHKTSLGTRSSRYTTAAAMVSRSRLVNVSSGFKLFSTVRVCPFASSASVEEMLRSESVKTLHLHQRGWGRTHRADSRVGVLGQHNPTPPVGVAH